MSEIREMRQRMGLSQQERAALLDVAVETFRLWDSGRHRASTAALQRARATVAEYARQREPLSLDQLASEFGIHQRTLRAAARTGRLDVQFASRFAFGRPVRGTVKLVADALNVCPSRWARGRA